MKKMKEPLPMNKLSALTFAFFLAVASVSAADLLPSVQLKTFSDKTQIDSVLVSVNGEPITLLDVILETAGMERRLAGHLTGERLMRETHRIRMEAVEMIILHKLLYLEYLKRPFPIPNQEVESMIDKFATEMGDGTRETLEKHAVLYRNLKDPSLRIHHAKELKKSMSRETFILLASLLEKEQDPFCCSSILSSLAFLAEKGFGDPSYAEKIFLAGKDKHTESRKNAFLIYFLLI